MTYERLNRPGENAQLDILVGPLVATCTQLELRISYVREMRCQKLLRKYESSLVQEEDDVKNEGHLPDLITLAGQK